MPLSASELSTLSRLLDDGLTLEVGQLEGWLASLDLEHRHLMPRLREMLSEHGSHKHSGFMAHGPRLGDSPTRADETAAKSGDVVGPYRLIRELGRGGMGAVWLAERFEGGVKRQVALKLPRLAWDLGLAERMARERDIGALLEHPQIARLYDAGVDRLGRPYLALEYIDGQRLDTWCATRNLGVRERLRLFQQVARAVAYAHGRLVVHRDLKPSNVLVTADGQAHLLDFGIAKLLHEATPADDALTRDYGRVLTPHYASPEQLRGEAITVASDVYSLGTLLYELLTGAHPYESERKSLPALEQAVLHGDVALASSRVRDKDRARALRGELDAILGKALQREPAKRYATADALAEDIERHLSGERVLAQPDTISYRASKTLRRHRLGFAVTGAILLTVLAGAGISVVQAKRANDAAERARVVKEFVVDVFKVNDRANPANNELRQLPAELLLEHGAKLIATRFPGQPELQAELYGVVGRIFADMGSSKLAVEYATKQIESLTVIHASDEELARAMLLLAENLAFEDQLSDAALRARRALEYAAGNAALQIQARVAVAKILVAQANYGEAGVELDRVAQSLQALSRPLPLELARSEAMAQWQRALITVDFNEQVALFEKAIEKALAAEGTASRLAAEIRIDFAYGLSSPTKSLRSWSQKQRGAVAAQQIAAALAAMRSVGGPDDIGAALAQSKVTAMLAETGVLGFDEAIEAVTGVQQIIAQQGRKIPEAVRAWVDFDLGWIYRNGGNVERAYALQSAAVTTLRPNAQSPFALLVLETSLGMDASETGRHHEADQLLRRGLEWRKVNSLSQGVMVSHGYIAVAWNLVMQGRYDEAERELVSSPPSQELVSAKALIRLERGDARGALELLDSMKPIEWKALDDEVLVTRGRALCRLGKTGEGLPLLEEVIAPLAGKSYEHSPSLAHLRSIAGQCALAAGRRDTAVALAQLSRRAFVAQPGVSPYYKAPLQQLESALARRR